MNNTFCICRNCCCSHHYYEFMNEMFCACSLKLSGGISLDRPRVCSYFRGKDNNELKEDENE